MNDNPNLTLHNLQWSVNAQKNETSHGSYTRRFGKRREGICHRQQKPSESRKLEPRYRGPCIVVKVLGNDRYVIEDIPSIQNTGR